MTIAPVDTRGASTARSRVRVKSAVLFIAFMACWLVLSLRPHWHEDLVLVVAGVSAVLYYFIRCEQCHSSIYYRAGGKRVLFPGPSTISILTAKRCPCCGLERI